jgi:uncharacterized protein (TIGR00369 family)
MNNFQVQDPDYETRIHKSFANQTAMSTLGVSIVKLAPGMIEFAMPYAAIFTQQNGFLHAGILSAALDSACGYSAYTLMPKDADILTVEFKVNLLSPAKGQSFRFVGNVVKPGRTLIFSEGRAYAIDDGREKLIATMSGTMMTMLRTAAS